MGPTAVSQPDASGGGWRSTAGNSSRTSSKQSLVTSSSTPWHSSLRLGTRLSHVHDEIVIDEPEDSGFTIADACQLTTTPTPTRLDSRTATRRRRVRMGDYYRKD